MSIEELRLVSDTSPDLSFKRVEDKLMITIDVPCAVAILELNQIQMLVMYLQEFLK